MVGAQSRIRNWASRFGPNRLNLTLDTLPRHAKTSLRTKLDSWYARMQQTSHFQDFDITEAKIWRAWIGLKYGRPVKGTSLSINDASFSNYVPELLA